MRENLETSIYNYNQKIQYLEGIKESIDNAEDNSNTRYNILISKFKAIKFYEEHLDKDCCDFTLQEIVTMYSILNAVSVNSLKNTNSLFNSYTAWCMKNKAVKTNQNHYEEIDVDMLRNCLGRTKLRNKLYTKKELYEALDEIEEINHQVIILGLFEGLKDNKLDSLLNATINDVDFDNNRFRMKDGRWLDISYKLAELMQDSYNQNSDANYKPSEYILKKKKWAKNDVFEYTNVTSMCNIIKKKLGYVFTPNYLFISGLIDMIHGLAEKNNLTYEQVTKMYYKDLSYKYGKFLPPDIKDSYDEVY